MKIINTPTKNSMECSHKREEINNHNLFSKQSLWNAPTKGKKLILQAKSLECFTKSEKIFLLRKHHPSGMLPETQGKSTQVT